MVAAFAGDSTMTRYFLLLFAVFFTFFAAGFFSAVAAFAIHFTSVSICSDVTCLRDFDDISGQF